VDKPGAEENDPNSAAQLLAGPPRFADFRRGGRIPLIFRGAVAFR
jgi:hypothetical protein